MKKLFVVMASLFFFAACEKAEKENAFKIEAVSNQLRLHCALTHCL